MSRIQVLAQHQSLTDSPAHSASKVIARLAVQAKAAVIVGKNLIHLVTEESWGSLKNRLRPIQRPGFKTVPPSILPPHEPELLMLSYPPKNYESDGDRKQRKLWLSDACIPYADRKKA